jgi:hypothetical protein
MNSDDRFASRKFVLASASFLAGVILLSVGKIDAAQWVSYTTWVLGLYFGANCLDTAVERK